MSQVLQVANLSSGYGKLTILRDISFNLENKVTLGILGQNGAGKSTLLKTLVGLLPCNTGTIRLDGRRVERLAAFRRVRSGISMVPEGRQIFGEMTVKENLRLALNARVGEASGEHEDAEKIFGEIFDLFPILLERSWQRGGLLSGGQQQMLAIGRALVARPRVLMLDEPTQGLAPVVVKELRSALEKLKTSFSMIVVEQNREFLDGLADVVLRMEDGHIESDVKQSSAHD